MAGTRLHTSRQRPPHPRLALMRMGSVGRLGQLTLACAVLATAAVLGPAAPASAYGLKQVPDFGDDPGGLTQVLHFGDNPGGLAMYVYKPGGLAPSAPA